jgi:PE family/PPE-SVP subfamily C-terminal region
MSFVTTQPEALDFAAGKLEGIGSSLAAQNASAAAPTTGVVPAAADEVSALQAAQFTAYGSLYQQVSAQATAINQAFVQMLGTSAGSYGATEAANAAASGSTDPGFSIIGQLTQFGQFGVIPGALSNGSLILGLQGNMFGAAASDFLGLIPLASTLGGGGGAEAAGAVGGLGGLSLAGAAAPAGVGAAPVLAGLGQASAVGGLSVPPSWAAGGVPAASSTPATLAGAGWTSAAAPHGAPVTTVPGGVPSVASAGKASGLGAPRYGVKPTVMPKPKVV